MCLDMHTWLIISGLVLELISFIIGGLSGIRYLHKSKKEREQQRHNEISRSKTKKMADRVALEKWWLASLILLIPGILLQIVAELLF